MVNLENLPSRSSERVREQGNCPHHVRRGVLSTEKGAQVGRLGGEGSGGFPGGRDRTYKLNPKNKQLAEPNRKKVRTRKKKHAPPRGGWVYRLGGRRMKEGEVQGSHRGFEA